MLWPSLEPGSVLVLAFQVFCLIILSHKSDFRGPKGVWTQAAKGVKVDRNYNFEVDPTTAHMTLVGLQRAGLLKSLISTNTDGTCLIELFLKGQECTLEVGFPWRLFKRFMETKMLKHALVVERCTTDPTQFANLWWRKR